VKPKPIRIEQWSTYADPHHAPEIRTVSLVGNVYGHPNHPDGYKVRTSDIIRADGRTVHTTSGHIYVLGEIDPAFVVWMRENKIPFDPTNPIKVYNEKR